MNGKLQAAVRVSRGQGMGGVIYHGDTDSKTRLPVRDVLREKHLDLRTPELSNSSCASFDEYKEHTEVVLVDIYEEDVQ